MKKITALLLALVLCLSLCACGAKEEPKAEEPAPAPAAEPAAEAEPAPDEAPAEAAAPAAIKVGLVCLHDENSGYDRNFIDAFKAACETAGVEGVIKTNVAEDQSCYDAAAELADDGCSVIVSDSYGHQSYMLQAAVDFPEVQFTSCTGDTANLDGVENFHNAFAAIYEGRYVAGVAAGMKLNEMIANGEITEDQAKVGYVGAVTYAEIISGYTGFYLGVKSVCPSATMDVIYTGTWLDETLENEAANTLAENGCVLISQHADSMGAPNACETAGVPNVAYNASTMTACPNTYLIASRIDWSAYFAYIFDAVNNGKTYETDFSGGLASGMVKLTELNEAVAAEGTADKLAEITAAINDGSLKVFDTSTFTVNGETVTEFLVNDVNVVEDGAFNESNVRSAPYFDMIIDGITIK